ncbi:bacillithiol biosynthesis deacetylase BshB1 [Candidatus Bipolaricaulota bacterium]|nr:bacillithiol biosynthesis deacetylase BshB1 [Candidatus Bipolaricaulota bacterium]
MVDILAFGAHPDDIEISCGGTLIKLREAGYSLALIDLTKGEMGTRGSATIRAQEAERASELIGAQTRVNLGLPDGDLSTTSEAKRRIVTAVRSFRPRIAFLPYWEDRHPDHAHASRLVYDALFLSGLSRYETDQPAHRPTQVVHYMGWREFAPTFIVDISTQFERKMDSIFAYKTQFLSDASADPETRLTAEATHRRIEARMAYYGSLIGARYGEGFLIRGHLAVDDPLQLSFLSF